MPSRLPPWVMWSSLGVTPAGLRGGLCCSGSLISLCFKSRLLLTLSFAMPGPRLQESWSALFCSAVPEAGTCACLVIGGLHGLCPPGRCSCAHWASHRRHVHCMPSNLPVLEWRPCPASAGMVGLLCLSRGSGFFSGCFWDVPFCSLAGNCVTLTSSGSTGSTKMFREASFTTRSLHHVSEASLEVQESARMKGYSCRAFYHSA